MSKNKNKNTGRQTKHEQTEVPVKKSTPFPEITFKKLMPLMIGFVCYLFVFAIPDIPHYDRWAVEVMKLMKADSLKEPAEKKVIAEGVYDKLYPMVQQHPYHARLHYYLAHAYTIMGKTDSAISEFKKAYILDSGSVINTLWHDAGVSIGNAYASKVIPMLQSGQSIAARESLNAVIREIPRSSSLWKLLGYTFLQEQRPDSSLKYFLIAYKLNTKDDNLLNSIGVSYQMKNSLDTAYYFFSQALAINPNSVEARRNVDLINSVKKNK